MPCARMRSTGSFDRARKGGVVSPDQAFRRERSPNGGLMEPGTVDPPAARQTRHVAGLDTIRFVCALWVLFGHLGFLPLVAGIDRTSLTGYLIAGAFDN